jgi:hypothetical protein
VVLLVYQVLINPDAKAGCWLSVHLYETVSNTYLGCQFWKEEFIVALSACELCTFHFCGVEL